MISSKGNDRINTNSLDIFKSKDESYCVCQQCPGARYKHSVNNVDCKFWEGSGGVI